MTYNVRYRDVATQTVTEVTGISGLSLEVTGLVADTDYEFQVQEENYYGDVSAWTAWAPFTTSVAAVDIGADISAGLLATSEGAKTVSVAGGASAAVTVVSAAKVLVSASGVSLSSAGASGEFSSAWSVEGVAAASMTPLADGKTALNAQGVGTAQLTAVSADYIWYNVEYRDVATQTTTQVLGVFDTFLDVTGLTQGTDYDFRVQEHGGTWSAWTGFRTRAIVDAAAQASAVSALVADGIYTQDADGDTQSALTPSADVSVSRETAGASGSTFTALNLGIDVSSEGASFIQSALSSAGDAHADRVTGASGLAQLSVTGEPGQGTEVNVEGISASVLIGAGEATRAFSVASFQGSTLVATGSPTEPVLAAASGSASSTGQASPEVTRGITGQAGAVLSTAGVSSIGRDVASSPVSALLATGDAFIDRGFEVAADVVMTSVGVGTPAYDAAAEGQGAAVASGAGTPAVTKDYVGAGVAELFTSAVPGRDIEVSGVSAAALAGLGSAEAGLVIQAGGSGAASSTGAAAPAATISVAAQWATALVTVGQGATNQEGAGSATMVLRIAAETTGGTPVEPRILTAHRVAIFPSMSCYTKVTPSMYGNGAIRPR